MFTLVSCDFYYETDSEKKKELELLYKEKLDIMILTEEELLALFTKYNRFSN